MNRMTWCALVLCALLLLVQSACAEDFYTEMPPAVRFTQETVVEEAAHRIYIQRTYPDTVNDDVDAQIRALVDEMTERNRPSLSLDPVEAAGYLDVGAVVTRSGESALSFLALAEVSRDFTRLGVEMTTRVYDMETGRRLSLEDLFDADSGAWALMAEEIRAQISAYFPGEEPDAAALDALCAAEAIRSADFTLSGGRMTLTYRADAVYTEKKTLLHVQLYYPQIRPLMNAYGQKLTDNSRYRMVALTYDDGGARNSTRRLLDVMRRYGASATFFLVGRTMRNNNDLLCRQHDSGYSQQSHTYYHNYPYELTKESAFEEKRMFAEELASVTGLTPTMMRAPGGNEDFYIRHEIGYPLIHWSLAGGDSGSDNAQRVSGRVLCNVCDGDVVLMHDTNSLCSVYTEKILESLTAQGYLCVTVEELFSDAGAMLGNEVVYFSPYRTGGMRTN
ncbi:MAG: polysaccharide deacetylase family protein [Clostridia bacterium]|nr:polysaccharide deacetylase family protein [Clostridia bacterium]